MLDKTLTFVKFYINFNVNIESRLFVPIFGWQGINRKISKSFDYFLNTRFIANWPDYFANYLDTWALKSLYMLSWEKPSIIDVKSTGIQNNRHILIQKIRTLGKFKDNNAWLQIDGYVNEDEGKTRDLGHSRTYTDILYTYVDLLHILGFRETVNRKLSLERRRGRTNIY